MTNLLPFVTRKMFSIAFVPVLGILGITVLASCLWAKEAQVFTRPKKAAADPAFAIQGEYAGEVRDQGISLGVQIVALGGDKFQARAYMGGLPGDGWDGDLLPLLDGELKDGTITFRGDQGDGIYRDGKIVVVVDGNEVAELKKVDRKSPTLGKKPPEGAIVLFDGKHVDAWNDAKLDGKTLAFDPKGRGATSKQKFGSHHLHIEFRTPYMPQARGQGRGNSGLYLQSRYEVQMLDSFGLDGKQNECGGVYSISAPKLNMCYPPLRWQTYDVDFTAAVYEDGKVVKQPRMTVRHNGVLIHRDLELPHSTTASPRKPGPEDAPVYLQNHGNPVRYRNIWVVPK